MPQSDHFNVKSPIELLRQLLDYGGWYDTKINELAFKLYSNMTIIATCLESQKNSLNLRQTRHFNILKINPLTKDNQMKLYNTLIDNVFTDCD